MQVLRSGKDCFIQECDYCCCLFSYGKEDVTAKTWRNETIYNIVCPECGGTISPTFKKRKPNGKE